MRPLNRSKLCLNIRVGQIESRLGRTSVKQWIKLQIGPLIKKGSYDSWR